MGQWFKLVNFDKRKTVGLCKLSESLYDGSIHSYLTGEKFTLRTADEFIDRQRKWLEDGRLGTRFLRYRGPHDQQQSALMRTLPVEIIAMCVASAANVYDKACFALTCRTAWDIARPDLARALRAESNWQGDRIMVLGEYVVLDDMPPNVLNDEEHAVIRALEENAKEGDWPCVDEFLNALGAKKAGSVKEQFKERLRANRPPSPQRCRSRDLRNQDDFIWGELVSEMPFDVESRGAVLRNLTTHEYVRGEARHAARKAAGRPFNHTPLYNWCFGDILLMRICWSPSSDRELLEGHNPRNVWAGHRFDFAREDALPCDADGEVLPPWKDVSEDFMKELSEWSKKYDVWEKV